MNRVPQKPSPPDTAQAAGPGDWVSPAQSSGGRYTSWRNLFAGIWPIHRAVLLGCLGAAALLALALVWYRQWSIGVVSDVIAGPACRAGASLDSPDCVNRLSDAQYEVLRTPGGLLTLACAAVTAGAGVILGVSVFARDFEQRTQVFLLGQSVSRIRWWAAKSLFVVVPWTLAMLGLGGVAAWAFSGVRDALSPFFGDRNAPMDPDVFYLSPLGLFVVGTVAVCTGVTTGIVLRATLGAILVTGLVTAALIVGAEVARPYLVPTDRIVSVYDGSGSAWSTVPADSWYQNNGYLDSAGREVAGWTADCSDLFSGTNESTSMEETSDLDRQCAARSGIVSDYTDVILPSRFGLLRLLWSGGLLAASALLLVGGLLRVRRRVL